MFAQVVLFCFCNLLLVQRLCFAFILLEENFKNKSGYFKVSDIRDEGCLLSSYVDVLDNVRCLGSTSCSVCFYILTPRFWTIDQLEFDFNGNAGTKIVILSSGFEKEFVVTWDDTWNTYRTQIETHGRKTFFFIDRDPPCDFQCLSNIRIHGSLQYENRGLAQHKTVNNVKKYGRWRDEEIKVHFVLTITFLTFATFFAVAMIMCICQKSKHSSW